jgi:hypothetical protein
MSRKSIAVLERNLEHARKREAYMKRTDRPVKPTVDKRPKILIGYRSALIKTSTASALLKIQASDSSVTWFGGAGPLGLIVNTGANLDDALPAPRGLTPSQIHAVVGDTTPSVKIAAGSGRRYIKYSANAAGEAQSSYNAPISNGTDTTTTLDEQQNKAQSLGVSGPIAAKLGGEYGRVWFTPERYSESNK